MVYRMSFERQLQSPAGVRRSPWGEQGAMGDDFEWLARKARQMSLHAMVFVCRYRDLN
jgi:hypothetical protein